MCEKYRNCNEKLYDNWNQDKTCGKKGTRLFRHQQCNR